MVVWLVRARLAWPVCARQAKSPGCGSDFVSLVLLSAELLAVEMLGPLLLLTAERLAVELVLGPLELLV